jgi:signal-transduction protein with cAMP-binding, CBS, and nucleotidyltransferase domain
MPIEQFCTKGLFTIGESSSVADAARRMKEENAGALVAVDEKGKATGILTDRDIVVGAVAKGRDWNTKVNELMSKQVLHVEKAAGVAETIERMSQKEVRRALIVDERGAPCGLVSTDDLLELLGTELHQLGKIASRQCGQARSGMVA